MTRRWLIAAGGSLLALICVELGSSYFLFRFYARSHTEFRPVGLATLELFDRLRIRLHGARKNVETSIDHGPLFDSDAVLGYRLVPGSYAITEHLDNIKHAFHLTVDEQRRRVVSYTPVQAASRLVIATDSAIFGWGLDDEQTVPWLLQTRLPNYQVVNLSLTSYSTVQSLLRLRQLEPKLQPNDILVLNYHPVTNVFNVAGTEMLHGLVIGYEFQLGDAGNMRRMQLPYGRFDKAGALEIARFNMGCLFGDRGPACVHQEPETGVEMAVTQRTFDAILAMHPGRTLVVWMNGADDDQVIAHVKSKGAEIVDVRYRDGDADKDDVIPTHSHPGPYWHIRTFTHLLKVLTPDARPPQASP